MQFHLKKCKALSVSLKHPNYYILPFDRFAYELDNSIIDYYTEETDLGMTITNKLNWETQDKILLKAKRQLGMTKRICYFVKNVSQKRSLYITLVRSLFEHGGEVWGPNPVILIAKNKFEPLQKRAVKWILGEMNKKYNDQEYHKKLYKLDLTMHNFFLVKKLKLFRSIIYGISSIAMPDYVIPKQDSRTIDNRLNFAISSDIKQPIIMTFGSSYFPSCIELWNALPYNIKNLNNSNEFLVELKNHIWQHKV